MNQVTNQPILHQGQGTPIGGTVFRHKIRAQDTGGRLFVLESVMQPGTLVIPHTHTREDELTFVYRGTIGVRIGENEYIAPAGSLVFKPRGVLYIMWNPTHEPAILFETITPAGLEGFFEEMGQITVAQRQADPTIGETVAERYGLRAHGELIPELMAKHNVCPG